MDGVFEIEGDAWAGVLDSFHEFMIGCMMGGWLPSTSGLGIVNFVEMHDLVDFEHLTF